jgi:hypothetical protein
MGLKDLVELDFVAVFARSSSSRRGWSLGDQIGAIGFLGSRDDLETRLLEVDRPIAVGGFKDGGTGKEGIEDQESLRAMALNEGQRHVKESSALSVAIGMAWQLGVDMKKALVETGF